MPRRPAEREAWEDTEEGEATERAAMAAKVVMVEHVAPLPVLAGLGDKAATVDRAPADGAATVAAAETA